MVCRSREIILSFYQKDKITEQVHNDVEQRNNVCNKKTKTPINQ